MPPLRRTDSVIAAVAFGVAVLVGAGTARADEQLALTGWGGSLQPVQRAVYFQPFTKATGIKVVEDEWAGELAKLRAMVKSGASGTDMVGIGGPALEIGCNEGLLIPIDYSKLGGKERFVPGSTHECGVPTSTGSAVVVYNADKFGANPPKTAKDFFDLTNFPGPRALRARPQYTLEFALLADGVPVADLYKVLGTEEGLARAFRKLDTIKPSVKVWFTPWAEAIQLLVDGEVVMTMNGNARVAAAVQQDKKNLVIIWDNQAFDYDYWALVKGGKNTDNAMKLIEFASQDAQMDAFIHKFQYGPTLNSVVAAMPPEIAKNMPSSPANMATAYRVNAAFWSDHLDDYTVRFNAWLSK
jgi:putative spermidine/putrescine transport system substrate-binding protein